MEANLFDRLTRILGAAGSRRRGLKAIAWAAGAAATAGEVSGERARRGDPQPAGPCGPKGRNNRCKGDRDCCTGYCRPAKKGKTRRCRCAPRNYPCTGKTVCCKQMVCIDGMCMTDRTVVTGQPCIAGTSVCRDAAAVCREYDSESPAGTFCLLPTGGACTGGGECYSQQCAGGACAAVTCDVCGAGCAYSTIEAAVATPPAGGRIRVAPGTYAMASTVVSSTLRVEACDGASGVNIVAPAGFDPAFKVEAGGKLTARNLSFTSNGAPAIFAAGADEANRVSAVMAGCTLTAFNSKLGLGCSGYCDVVVRDSTLDGARLDIGSIDGSDRCSMLLERSTISNLASTVAIESTDNSDLTLIDSVVTNCSASDGGGIAVIGGENHSPSSGSLVLAGSTRITANNGTTKGGGLYLRPGSGNSIAVTMRDSATIVANTSPRGSGIAAYTDAGTLTVSGAASRVSGNTGSPAQCERSSDFGANWVAVPDCESF